MRRVWIAVSTAAATACLLAAAAPCAPAAEESSGWSAPVRLAACGVLAGPQAAFPSSGPTFPTGRGVLAWAQDCAGGSGGPSLALAEVRRSGQVGAPSSRPLPAAPVDDLAAAGASEGRVAVALAGRDGEAFVVEDRGGSPAQRPLRLGRAGGLALTHAYLGDAAIATVRDDSIAVRVQRFFRSSFGRARRIPRPPGRVTALVATMDYRSDVLVAWQQDGEIYAHMLRASGRPDPTQRVGPSDPDPQLQALVSDNDHGMVAWSTQSRGRTRTYISLSEAEVRFSSPRRLASFEDPAGAGRSEGSLQLIRLAGENVLMAWTERDGDHYVVREAPAVFAGVRPSATLSDPAGQAVLDALAPGPENEAVALWQGTSGADAIPTAPRGRLWARRTYVRAGDRVGQGTAEAVADAQPPVTPSLAIDPGTDRALAVWRTGAGTIEYATGPTDAAYRPHPSPGAATPPRAGVHWLRLTLGALGLAGLVLAASLTARRRRRVRG